MTRSRRKLRRSQHPESRSPAELLHQLAAQCSDPVRFLQLWYWSAEPELAEVMRQFIALPETARTTLSVFFGMTEDNPKSVTVTLRTNGEITLSSPVVSEFAEAMEVASIGGSVSESVH